VTYELELAAARLRVFALIDRHIDKLLRPPCEHCGRDRREQVIEALRRISIIYTSE
jgi:hypothetical protein